MHAHGGGADRYSPMSATAEHIGALAAITYRIHGGTDDMRSFVNGFVCGYAVCEFSNSALQPGGGHSQNTQRTLDTTPPGFQSSAVETETPNKCFGAFGSAETSGPVQCEGGAAAFQKESSNG